MAALDHARKAIGRDVPAIASCSSRPCRERSAGVEREPDPDERGAKSSAGRKLPTLTSDLEQLQRIPMISTPPALVSAASASLPSARMSSNRPAASVIAPW